MKLKAPVNNPYHRPHSTPGGRKKVQKGVGVSETVRVNRFAEGKQLPVFKASDPDEQKYEIDLSVPFAIVIAFLIALVSVQLYN